VVAAKTQINSRNVMIKVLSHFKWSMGATILA